MWKSFVLELHGWSEFADECIGLHALVDRDCFRLADCSLFQERKAGAIFVPAHEK